MKGGIPVTKLQTLKERYFPSGAGYTLKEQLGYCAGIFGNCMGQDSTDNLSDKFSRKFMKIDEGHMTLSGNLTLLVGFLSGAASGYILDTPVKKNRLTPARLFTGVMPIPFMIATILLFVVPSADPNRNFIWMLAFRLLFRFSDSFYDASLNTLSLRMVDRAEDRKSFFTVGTFASALGGMLPEWLISLLVGTAKNNAPLQQKYYFFCTLAFSLLGVVMMLQPFFTMKEKIRLAERPEKQKLSWDKQTLLSVLHNRPFLVVEGATFFEQIRQISYRLFPYLYEDVLGSLTLKVGMDAVSGSLSYLGLAAVPYLSRRFAPRTILSGGFAYTGFFYALIGLFGLRFRSEKVQKQRFVIGLLTALAGLPNNAISASKKIVIGDSTDYMEWYAEKQYDRPIHAEGFITASQSILGSTFDIIRTNVYNIWFGKLGFKPNYTNAKGEKMQAVQSEQTLQGIFRMFVLCGVIGNFCAAIMYLFDNYHGARKEEIAAELAAMRDKRRQIVDERVADVGTV